MTVVCYTDASYRKEYDIAACGYCVRVFGKMVKHCVEIIYNIGGPGHAEVYAIVQAAQFAFMIKGVEIIIIYTDYQGAVDGRKRGKKYDELRKTIEMISDFGINIELIYVKAHSINKHNNLVDRECRANLRKYIKENGINKTKRRNGA